MDLCKNCGSCHLGIEAVRCTQPIRRCEKCLQLGHSTNFCPLGQVPPNTMAGPEQMFMMICSNCDKWHLPYPCQHPLQVCAQCGAQGHLSVYCPINPVPRVRQHVVNKFEPPPNRAPASRKRKHYNEDEQDRLMVKLPLAVLDIKHVHPTLVRQIQHHMAGQMVAMLTYHSRDDVLRFLQHRVPLPEIKTDPHSFRAFSNVKPEVFSFPHAGSQQHQHQVMATSRDSIASPAIEQTPGIPVTPQTAQKAKRDGVSDFSDVTQPRLSVLPSFQASRQYVPVAQSRDGVATLTSSTYHEMMRPQTVAHADGGLPYGQANFQGGALHAATGDLFISHGQQQAEMSMSDDKYLHYHAAPSQTWSVHAGGHDLNVLATAAEQVTSHASQTEQTFDPYSVHSNAVHQANEQYTQNPVTREESNGEYHNVMDFSHLLNSDAASGPTPPNEQPERMNTDLQDYAEAPPPEHQVDEQAEQVEQLNAELQDAAEEITVKPPKKRSGRKKSEQCSLPS